LVGIVTLDDLREILAEQLGVLLTIIARKHERGRGWSHIPHRPFNGRRIGIQRFEQSECREPFLRHVCCTSL